MLYNRDRDNNVTPGIVLMDEAFRKMDTERSGALLDYARSLGLQIIMAIPSTMSALTKYADSVIGIATNDDENDMIVAPFDVKAIREEETEKESAAST